MKKNIFSYNAFYIIFRNIFKLYVPNSAKGVKGFRSRR